MFPLLVAGQAVVEYSLGAGRAGAAAASKKNAGKAIGSVFENLAKTLEKGKKPEAARSSRSKVSQPTGKTSEDAIGSSFEDPGKIQPGIEYEELLRRFGRPQLETVDSQDARTMWYSGQTGESAVKVAGGKVTAVSHTPKERAANVVSLR
jgi:hypothetical protein